MIFSRPQDARLSRPEPFQPINIVVFPSIFVLRNPEQVISDAMKLKGDISVFKRRSYAAMDYGACGDDCGNDEHAGIRQRAG
jgi:hypothetical protein